MSAAIELRTTSPVFATSSAAMRFPPLAALFLWAERRLRRFQRAHPGSGRARGQKAWFLPAKSRPVRRIGRFHACASRPLRKSVSRPETGVVSHLETNMLRASVGLRAAQPNRRCDVRLSRVKSGCRREVRYRLRPGSVRKELYVTSPALLNWRAEKTTAPRYPWT
jgi:hypothetical protein